MTVGIFGLGRFGSFWSALLAQRFDVVAYARNPDRPAPPGVQRVSLAELGESDTIFVCVAIRAVPEALDALSPHLSPGCLVADTCSVKTAPAAWLRDHLPAHVDLLATHPMFGPESAKEGLAGLALMMDPLRLAPVRAEFWERTFTGLGLTVVRMSCDRHDREAAFSQALTHFVGRSVQRIGLPDTAIATRWYEKLRAVANQCVRDAPELFEDMQNFNPYAPAMRRTVLAAFAATCREAGDNVTAAALDAAFAGPLDSPDTATPRGGEASDGRL